MRRRLRVAVAGLRHETNTFTPVETAVNDFTWFNDRGEALQRYRGTNTPVGGFLDGAALEGFDVVPTQVAAAHPSGPISRDGFEELLADLVGALEATMPLDGVLLDLHGAMAAEAYDDGDGEILRRVRRLVGHETPVVAQLDIHANLSQSMVEYADLLVGRRTFPEIDMAARGRDCARLLGRLARERVKAEATLCRLPLIWGTAQATGHGDMATLMQRLDAILAEPDVLTACVLPGFRWADTSAMGSSVYVATTGRMDRARRLAEELAEWIIDHVDSWYEDLPSTHEAIPIGREHGRYPVVFADYLDNPGNGAPGDGTALLRAFIDAQLEDACVLYIVDPVSVQRCFEAGVDASVRLRIGGHSHPAQGPPVEADARIASLSDGRFTYTTLYAGLEANLGPSALVAVEGVHCVLISGRDQPFDPAFAASLGLDCRSMRWIGLKSMHHFRAGFEEFAGFIQLVEEPNVNGPVLRYEHLGRPVYPIDADALERELSYSSGD
jgi:microcystin degradation protein MlrC